MGQRCSRPTFGPVIQVEKGRAMWREPPDLGTWSFRENGDRSRPKSRTPRTAEERSSEHARRVNASLRLAHLDEPRQADELPVILEELAALKSA